MDNSVYEAPQAELTEHDEFELADEEFYIVSTTKFALLYMGTFGLYSIYWFYRNWKVYKMKNGEDIWPVARGIFNIFFAHSLFNYVNSAIENKSLEHKWSPNGLATMYVLLAIFSQIFEKLANKSIGSPVTDVISILTIPAACFILAKAQNAINISQSDPEGKRNTSFTWINYIWCTAGFVLWLAVAVGFADMFGLIQL